MQTIVGNHGHTRFAAFDTTTFGIFLCPPGHQYFVEKLCSAIGSGPAVVVAIVVGYLWFTTLQPWLNATEAYVYGFPLIPLGTDGPEILGHVDHDSFSKSCSVEWLTSYSSRADPATRGSSISFLTRASIARLDSCFGWFLCILAQCHESRAIAGQLGTKLAVSELFCSEHFCTVRTNLP